jgi:hypothetical protein
LTCREHYYALSLRDIEEGLGVRASEVYSWLYEYGDIVGYKYTDTTELYLVRVMKAMSKQLTPEQVERVAKLTRELMEKYPVITGKPVHRVLVYALVACKVLGVKVCKYGLMRELGVSDYIYNRVGKLYKTIKRLSERCVKKD